MATTRTSARTRSSTTRGSSTSSGRRKTQDVAGTTKAEASRVADTASRQAADVAATGKEQARQVTDEAMQQAQQLMGQATAQLQTQAGEQTQRLSANLRQLGEHFATMAGSGESGTTAQSLVRQLADRAHQAADYLEGRQPGEILDDVQRLGRRRPGAFFIGAALAGVAAGRLTTAVKDADEAGAGQTATPVDPYPASGGGW